jgi:hypothetical protein
MYDAETPSPSGCTTIVIVYNSGLGSGDNALRESWLPDVKYLLDLDIPCIFTCANDYMDVPGEVDVMRQARANFLLQPCPNPFGAMTILVAEGEGNSECTTQANAYVYAVKGRDPVATGSAATTSASEASLHSQLGRGRAAATTAAGCPVGAKVRPPLSQGPNPQGNTAAACKRAPTHHATALASVVDKQETPSTEDTPSTAGTPSTEDTLSTEGNPSTSALPGTSCSSRAPQAAASCCCSQAQQTAADRVHRSGEPAHTDDAFNRLESPVQVDSDGKRLFFFNISKLVDLRSVGPDSLQARRTFES